MILIGSTAVDFHMDKMELPRIRTKRLDVDFIVSKPEYDLLLEHYTNSSEVKEQYLEKENKYIVKFKDGGIVEYDIAVEGTTSYDLLEASTTDSNHFTYTHVPEICMECSVPSLDILYALKMSHRFKKDSPHFWKTRKDIMTLRELGAVIPVEYQEWFVKREKETYTYSHPKLNQDKKGFFTDSVPYKYSHDDIHVAVALQDKPAYQYYAIEGEEVLSSKDKFFNQCNEYTRLCGVYEESCVLALERAVIPHNVHPDKAFKMALMKVCSSITSGWFRSWAYDHIDEVLKMYDGQYVNKFKKGLEDGVVNLHTP